MVGPLTLSLAATVSRVNNTLRVFGTSKSGIRDMGLVGCAVGGGGFRDPLLFLETVPITEVWSSLSAGGILRLLASRSRKTISSRL